MIGELILVKFVKLGDLLEIPVQCTTSFYQSETCLPLSTNQKIFELSFSTQIALYFTIHHVQVLQT